MSISKIWVFGETNDSGVTTTTLELLARARELADTVEVVVAGDGNDVAAVLGANGANSVLACGDLSGQLLGVPVASAMAAAIEAGNGPGAILFATSYDGRDVAARLSAKLGLGVITNVVALEEVDGGLAGVEPVFGGTTDVTTKFTTSGPGIFLVRPKSFAAEETGGPAASVSTLAVPDAGATGATKVTNRHVEEQTGPSLDDAAIVVSGGRGMGDAEKYGLVETLAKLLGGAPGASRAIVDAGWVPYSYQVGQTGKVVKPTVYIAAGISGATQHLVGMKGSKNIIAINKDPEAPIFAVADLGIVGDVHKVLPKVIEAIQNR
jgi:electron transfer flavoprotein alpha subunit